jgi:hypothetical protein
MAAPPSKTPTVDLTTSRRQRLPRQPQRFDREIYAGSSPGQAHWEAIGPASCLHFRAGWMRDLGSRRSFAPGKATEHTDLQVVLRGATGLEPATSGVTGRSRRLRDERGSAAISAVSRAFGLAVPGIAGSGRELPAMSCGISAGCGVVPDDNRGAVQYAASAARAAGWPQKAPVDPSLPSRPGKLPWVRSVADRCV